MATKEALEAYKRFQSAKIKRKDICEQCGTGPTRGYDPIQAHHDDYSKPLEVRWLCRSCHQRHHAALRRARKLKSREAA